MAVRRLGPGDGAVLRAHRAVYRDAFADAETYDAAPPDDAEVERLLGLDHLIELDASIDGESVGALTAYVLPKIERERSEIYLYDLAVVEARRRQGVASALIGELRAVARRIGAWMIFVQADRIDTAAVALYDKFGEVREEPFHFDIRP